MTLRSCMPSCLAARHVVPETRRKHAQMKSRNRRRGAGFSNGTLAKASLPLLLAMVQMVIPNRLRQPHHLGQPCLWELPRRQPVRAKSWTKLSHSFWPWVSWKARFKTSHQCFRSLWKPFEAWQRRCPLAWAKKEPISSSRPSGDPVPIAERLKSGKTWKTRKLAWKLAHVENIRCALMFNLFLLYLTWSDGPSFDVTSRSFGESRVVVLVYRKIYYIIIQ